ncbi:MAG: hypothetical protein ACK41T_05180 [Pseudobdellovibrio sp.]
MIQKNKKFTAVLALTGSLAFIGFSCAGHPQKAEEVTAHKPTVAQQVQGTDVSNKAAVENQAHNFVELKFDAGKATLTESSRQSLDKLVAQARAAGKIDEVMVLSWADQEYPSTAAKRLSKEQRDLADARNKQIEKYVTASYDYDVETYNMAERPNVLSKWFNTSDYKLKKSFVAAGLPTTANDPQLTKKASRSVVLVKIE